MEQATVKSWRDEVSATLGRLDERTQNIVKKLDVVCNTQAHNKTRIRKLETLEANRSAVQKKMNIVYGMIITVVTAAANFAWNLIK